MIRLLKNIKFAYYMSKAEKEIKNDEINIEKLKYYKEKIQESLK